MKNLIFIIAILGSVLLNAQSWEEIQMDLFDYLKTDVLILTDEGLLKGEDQIEKYITDFEAANGTARSYTKDFGIEVNAALEYEIGKIQSNASSYAVMFLKAKEDDGQSKVEFLIIYKESAAKNETSALDSSRSKWMALCNDHLVKELVEQLYTPDAYYYNRGRLLQGTPALTSEYRYMSSPSYSLKLTPEHIAFVSSDIAYELGQCSGTYPLPYLLVWQKQADGRWLILMDSNY